MTERRFLALVLAAGHGTRFKSQRPKVLHEVAGRSLVAHVAASAAAAGASKVAVVAGAEHVKAIGDAVAGVAPSADIFVQHERRGTAHAALAARDALSAGYDDVVVLLGDAPLVQPQTIARVRAALGEGAAVAVLGFQTDAPGAYGRLLTDGDTLLAIREAKDASAQELAVTYCNSGIIGLAGSLLPGLLDEIDNQNAQKEYYLTDVVEVARRHDHKVVAIEGPEDEVHGINDRAQLAACEARFQARTRREMLAAGVTLRAPETVFFAADTIIAPDVEIEQNVVFGLQVRVEQGAVIKAFSHLEGAHIGAGASVGPFARLRPGSEIGANAKIGNFVEIKKTDVGAGAKVNHLSYVGDASIGARANLGAGTITCNYDGFFKYETTIGADAFIGSNSALVAPVLIDEGAFVGSGSVITEDVSPGDLAIGRGRQVTKAGWADQFRTLSAARKADRKKTST